MSEPIVETHLSTNWRPILMSLMTHTLLGLFLFLLWNFSNSSVVSTETLRRGKIVLATAEPDTNELKFLSDDSSEIRQPNTEPPISSPLQPLDSIANEAFIEPIDAIGSVPIDSVMHDANPMTEPETVGTANSAYELTAEDLEMIADDQRLIESRKPVGQPATISVFGGGELTGRSFVFVLDRSRSMGSEGLGVIRASRNELSAAVQKLEAHHKFQIVGYHDRTVSMKDRSFLLATAENKNAVEKFIGSLAAFGSTSHESAVIVGLTYKPEVLVFMTDAGYPKLNDNQLAKIHLLADDQTQIHCLQFGAGPLQESSNFMMKLANQNQGTFRYIDVNKWEDK